MSNKKYGRLKAACYMSNITMSVVGNLSPLLFLTFRNLYNISYSLLGLLVLLNFSTQLAIDLIFSFFSHRFNISKTIKIMPAIAALGLAVYALSPVIFPNAVFGGLVIATVIFSVSSGLAEVIISPVIAAIPADNPDREMSKLHSVYAWGVVGVVISATLFLLIFGQERWQLLPLLLMLIPLCSLLLFMNTQIPEMKTPEKAAGAFGFIKNKGVFWCVLAIFLGGASECTMAQWASSYLEQALSIPKIWGDIFGVALFAAALGFGRSLYSKIGKNAPRALLLGSIGAFACYLIAAFSPVGAIGLLACAFTGFCVSMLWPGSLIIAADSFPNGGVVIYALMAAGGDLGASVGPQLVGIVTDIVMLSGFSTNPEQFGMKAGMLAGAIFPFAAILVYSHIKKQERRKKNNGQ